MLIGLFGGPESSIESYLVKGVVQRLFGCGSYHWTNCYSHCKSVVLIANYISTTKL